MICSGSLYGFASSASRSSTFASSGVSSLIEIGKIKAARGLAMKSPMREHELIEEARADATALGVNPDYIQQLFEVILDNSRAAQQSAVDAEGIGAE